MHAFVCVCVCVCVVAYVRVSDSNDLRDSSDLSGSRDSSDLRDSSDSSGSRDDLRDSSDLSIEEALRLGAADLWNREQLSKP